MEIKEQIQSETFSLNRFTTLLKSDFIINKGSYLKVLLTVIGCFMAVAILVSIHQISEINNIIRLNSALTEEQLEDILYVKRINGGGLIIFFGLALMSLGLTVFGSLTFSSMSDKRHRIVTLMQPASINEKFLLRTLLYLVGGFALLVIGFFTGVLIGELSFGGAVTVWDSIEIFRKDADAIYETVIVVLWILCGNAIYTLGSALWPKMSWFKTWIVMTVVQWIFGIMLISGLFSGYDFERMIESLVKEETLLLWSIISAEIVVIGACWVLAWWRFRNTQIIQVFMKK